MIYRYLIHGYYAQEIKDFKDIKCSKAYVSQCTKEFLKMGCIEIIDRYPRRYSKGDHVYPGKLSNLTLGVQDFEQPHIHLNIIKFDILGPLKIDPANEDGVVVDSWTANNTNFVQISRMVDIGRINYRICNGKTLMIFTPGFFHDPANFRHYRSILLQKTEGYANWFSKTYGCKLGNMELCNDSDISIMEKDPFLQDMTQKYGLVKLVDHDGKTIMWWDQSKGFPEFETKKEDIAEIKAFMPLVTKNLQDRVCYLQQEVSAQGMVIEGLLSKIDNINNHLDQIKDLVTDLKKDLTVDLKEDSFEDVT